MIRSVGDSCTACGACTVVCPKGCISLERRDLGHLFPVVDVMACVHCGMCRDVCPALVPRENGVFTGEAYAFQAFDKELLADSSSGGAFGLLARNWIANGGVVYGAAWERGFGAHHVRASSEDELPLLRRSKYVQSSLDTAYAAVVCDLEAGTDVLFCGTPCQVAAIRAVSCRCTRRGKLATVDLVCHGVPSSALFEDYLDWKETKAGVRVIAYASRDKMRSGWSCLGSITFDGFKTQALRADDPYVLLFSQSVALRPSCYTCPYACAVRVGDLTIGDLWGAESLDLDFDLNLGLSVVLVNNEVGHGLLDSCSDDARMIPVLFDDVARSNRNLLQPSEVPAQREIFVEAYERYGFFGLAAAVSKVFGREGKKNRFKQMMPAGLKRVLKRMARKGARYNG